MERVSLYRPLDGLRMMRAATWAKEKDMIDAFAKAVFAQQFVYGRDLSGVDALAAVAEEVGLRGDDLRAAVDSPAVKDRLKATTASAWELACAAYRPSASARACSTATTSSKSPPPTRDSHP
jgi:2-hydroxychromene-2-carboxylate isomerase